MGRGRSRRRLEEEEEEEEDDDEEDDEERGDFGERGGSRKREGKLGWLDSQMTLMADL